MIEPIDTATSNTACRRDMLAPMRCAPILHALVFAGSLASCGPGAMPPSFQHPLAGAAAPSIGELGSQTTEVGVYRGAPVKATVVDFWASWCQGCQQSIPALDELYREKQRDGLSVIGVSVDRQSSDAYATAQALHASFPIIVDQDSRLMQSYGVAQVPLTFVVDRNGTVRWIGRDPPDVRRAVEVLLAE